MEFLGDHTELDIEGYIPVHTKETRSIDEYEFSIRTAIKEVIKVEEENPQITPLILRQILYA